MTHAHFLWAHQCITHRYDHRRSSRALANAMQQACMRTPHEREAEVLAGVAAREVAQHVVVVVLDDA